MKKLMLLLTAAMLLTSCQESLEKRIQRENREYTEKNCPQTFRQTAADGSEVILWLDSVVFNPQTATLGHYYRVNRPDIIQPEVQRAILLQQLTLDTNFQVHREKGYNFYFIYRYGESPDSILYEVTFTKNDY